MLEHLWLCWLIQAPYIAYFFGRYLQNRKRYVPDQLPPLSESHEGNDPLLISQITSKDPPAIVQDVIDRLNSVMDEVSHRYGNRCKHRIDLVVDENPSRRYDFHGVNLIVVPLDYKTARDSRYKCRALQYAVEVRRKRGENTRDVWIFHLDEESFVTTQCIERVLSYISNPNSPPVAEGPIIYPNRIFEVNPICRVVESMRPYICYDCVSQFDGSRLPIHMHGSNLLARADIEDEVGWDYRNPSSEDQRFGHNVWLKYRSEVFGWHGGIIEEQPPITINSLLKQRRRWFIGNLHNILTGSIPLRKKLEIVGRWFSWSTGFISSLVSIFALLLPQSIPDIGKIPLSIITILWFFSYQQGLKDNFRNLKLSKLKRIYYHLQTALLTPIAGLVETYGAFSAPFYIRKYKWEPTEKVRLRT